MSFTAYKKIPGSSVTTEIYPVTPETFRPSVQALAHAFVDDPVSIAVYPKFSVARRIKALAVDFSLELRLSIKKGCPVVATKEQKVQGAAVIYPPGSYPLPSTDQWYLLISSFVRNGFYNMRYWMRWLNEVEEYHPAEPHFYLEYIGVEPEYQGMGVGSAILKHLVDSADIGRNGCYLENANPRNTTLYQRFGFQVLDAKDIIGVPTWFMWRPPAK